MQHATLEPAIQHARAAEHDGNFPEALLRWQAAARDFPERPEGHRGVAAMLRNLERLDEAEVVLAAARERFPDNAQIAIDHAVGAHLRRDWAQVLPRWQVLRDRFGDMLAGYLGTAVALRQSGKLAEAEAVLRSAIAKYPDSPVMTSYWQMEKHVRAFAEPEVKRFLVDRAITTFYAPWNDIPTTPDRLTLHDFAAQHIGADVPVRYLEFGVARGDSILGFAKRFTHPEARFTGFDSFEGLPEQWEDLPSGAFSTGGQPPKTDDKRVDFVKGWFQNTLPHELPGLTNEKRPVLIHYDADIYSATLFLMTTFWHVFPDYYFVMDEFPGDEARALYDFALAYPVSVEILGKRRGGIPHQIFGRIKRTELRIGG